MNGNTASIVHLVFISFLVHVQLHFVAGLPPHVQLTHCCWQQCRTNQYRFAHLLVQTLAAAAPNRSHSPDASPAGVDDGMTSMRCKNEFWQQHFFQSKETHDQLVHTVDQSNTDETPRSTDEAPVEAPVDAGNDKLVHTVD